MASLEQKSEKKPHLTIDENEDNSRIDRVLCRLLGQEKRTLILRLIRKGNVRVNGKRVKPESRVQEGDSVFLPACLRPNTDTEAQASSTFVPAVKNLITLYEDQDLLIIDKQAGIVVH
ncbi:MAG: S4 domain-containing protein [Ghiorsea sp.]|nr:S4 domain-containing protein [Ghiorsea sp.]